MSCSAARVVLGLVVSISLAGCAGVSIHREPLGKSDKDKDYGIRYYQPAPFLLIYSDSKGGLTSKLIYLPDTTRVMTIKPYAYLAKNDATFKFDQGVLTQAKSVADETVIPNSVVTAIKTSALAAIAAGNEAVKEEAKVPAPYLYRIEIKDGQATLHSGARTPAEIQVTLAQPAKKN